MLSVYVQYYKLCITSNAVSHKWGLVRVATHFQLKVAAQSTISTKPFHHLVRFRDT